MVLQHPRRDFKTEQEKQAARILFWMIVASWVTYAAVILSGLYWSDWKLVITAAIGSALELLPFWLLRRNKVRASSFILMILVMATITGIASIGQGIRDVAVVAYPVVFVFADLTLDRNLFKACVAITVVALAWLALGEAWGWYTPSPFQGVPNWPELLVASAIILVSAFAVDLLASNMRPQPGASASRDRATPPG